MTADMSAWLYRTAYILCASRPYSLENSQEVGEAQSGLTDELTHISNLAVNKHTEGHPGQVSPSLSYPPRHPAFRTLDEASHVRWGPARPVVRFDYG